MAWDPDLYLKFDRLRLLPARDLIARIPAFGPRRISDLGCGTGNATRLLAERFPDAAIEAVDNSPAMLARTDARGIRWNQADIATWRPAQPPHLIFSNAALHWLDDHETLFPRLMSDLPDDGVLAVQMPRNFDAPTHRCIVETVRNGPWSSRLQARLRPCPVAAPSDYFDLLAPHASSVEIWETEYLHVLAGANPVADWTASTAMRPFLDGLEGEERAQFEKAYRERIARAYPRRPDGATLLPFRRLFILAVRQD
ncbi:MAG: methyltransferase domain-containing protein [Sphingomonadales bacterium]